MNKLVQYGHWVLGFLALLWLSPTVTWAQQGRLGAGTITSTTAGNVVNTYTTLTGSVTGGVTSTTAAPAGTTAITVADAVMTVAGGTAFPTGSNLATGDLLLIIQMQGATIAQTNSVAYGAVTDYGSAGLYEFSEVRSVSGTTITLACGLVNSYSVAGKTQVVRVPRYTTLTLSTATAPSKAITATIWDATTGVGGVVAVEVQGDLTMGTNTNIDVSGQGFKGGAVNNAGSFPGTAGSNLALTTYVTTNLQYAGEKGEGIAGSQTTYDNLGGRYGRGAAANGGGGGNNHNAGGGGGANVSATAWNNGQGNPASGYSAAWNLETSANNAEYSGSSFSTITSGGGGRGGYTYSGAQNNPLTTAPGNTAWAGDYRRIIGGLGGRPLSNASATGTANARLFMGGGGGAGHSNDNSGTSGGNGGGLIYLTVGGKITAATGTALLATGITVPIRTGTINTTANDAPGGGGGGGTIVINTPGTVGVASVSVVGGVGGNQDYASAEGEGPGGGGGGGYILTTATLSSTTITGGAGGTTNSTGANNNASAFPPNGATAGSAGLTSSFTYTQQCLVTADVQTVGFGPATGTVGQPIIYTLQTKNLSSSVSATNVIPTFTLPAGVMAAQVTLPTGASYNSATNVVTFATVATLAAGQSVSNTVRYTPTAAGTVTASAANTAGQPDPTLINNNGTATAAQVSTVIGAAPICANPGSNGSPAALSGVVNTYYPGTTSPSAGATSIAVGTAGGATATPIATGDLLLVIQMQGADISATNESNYGAGAGTGNGNSTTNFTAGTYEYVVAAGAVSGGSIPLNAATPLTNNYYTSAATTTLTRRSFQVVRVPQYGNVTLAGSVNALAWDGLKGGILAMDVAGTLTMANQTLSAAGLGFRGGAGIQYAGIGTATGYATTDYRTASAGTSGVGVNATKGEGIAGTPRYTAAPTTGTAPTGFSTALVLVDNTSTLGTTAFTSGVTNGYPNGDNGRGGPGNAGGGGTDGRSTDNGLNSGGAGGGNANTGGLGGYPRSANGTNPFVTTTQAVGGGTFAVASASRLVMGGGGGAGTNNDNNGGGTGIYSSGSPGGGIIMLRTGSISGTGTVDASGAGGNTLTPANATNDASGGGGAGGSVLITSRVTSGLSGLTVNAKGGAGNSNGASKDVPHGPGGGGAGGYVLLNAAANANSSVAGGAAGTTAASGTTTANDPYSGATTAFGATAGGTGSISTTTSTTIANSTAGAGCNDAPVAVNDLATTTPGVAVTFGTTTGTTAVAGNDTDATGGIDAASINLDPTSTTAIKTRTITGVGTFTADATTGAVTFTPVAGFVGVAELPYLINDVYGLTSNQAVIRVAVENRSYDLATTIASTPATGGSVKGNAAVPYVVVATNNSAGTAPNTVQTVQLQPGLTVSQLSLTPNTGTVTAATAGGVITFSGAGTTSNGAAYGGTTYNQTTGVLTFPATGLANGTPQTYNFSAAAPGFGPFTTVASIGNGSVDPVPANNTNSTTLTVTAGYDIGTTVTGPTTTPKTGNIVSYIVTATDAGATPAAGVVQLVTIGAGLTQVHTTGGGYYNSSSSTATVYYANGTFSATSSTGATSYSVAAGTIIYPPADLSASQTVNNIITFAAPAAGTTVTSTFTTASLANDSNNSGVGINSAAATLAATSAGTGTATNLRTTLTATNSGGTSVAPGTVAPGSSITYSAVLTNDGPTDATLAQEVVSLPAGLSASTLSISGSTSNVLANNVITYSGGANSGTTYNTVSGVLTFPSAGTLVATAGSNARTYGFTITAPANLPVINVTALASTSAPETSLDDNMAQATTTVSATDVSIVLSGPTTATVGQPVTYEAIVSNAGTSAATQVVATVAIPAGLSGVTVSGGGTYNSATGLVSFPTTTSLASGTSVPYTISYLAPGTATVVNMASVRTGSFDTNAANNASTVTTTTTAAADVVTSVSGPATANVGGTLTYAATTTNAGNSVATGATVPSLQLPTNLTVAVAPLNSTTIVTLRVNGQGPSAVTSTTATFPDGSTYVLATGVVTFPSISNQLPGATSGVTNTVTFDAPATTRVNVVAVGTPAAAANDLNLDNNSAPVTTTISAATASADLSVAVTANATSVTAGQTVLLTVTAQNSNSSANVATTVRTQVFVAPGLPTSGVNAVQVNGQTSPTVNATTGLATYTDGSTYDPTTGRVVFLPAIAALGIGESQSFTVQLAAPGTGTITAVASVRAENADPYPANNVANIAIATTTASVDLVTDVNGPATTTTGAPVSYAITTINSLPTTAGGFGGSAATTVVQTVTIPAGVGPATSAGFTIGGSTSGTVTYAGTQAGGYTISIPLGTVYPGTANAVVNTVSFTTPATVAFTVGSTVSSSPNNDAVPGNNTDSQATTPAAATTGPVAADIVVSTFYTTDTTPKALGNTLGNTAGQAGITALTATLTGTATSIDHYTITALPLVGTLYVNGTAVTTLPTSGLTVTVANAAKLTYDPAGTGAQDVATPSTLDASNQFFTFSATDNNNNTSNVARYTLPVNQDASTTYTVNTARPGAYAYVNGTEIARAYDYNGGRATSTTIFTPDVATATPTTSNGNATNVPNNGVRTATEKSFTTVSSTFGTGFTSLASLGMALNATTGQITVIDQNKLRTGNFKVSVTTTDLYGGVTTQDIPFSIGTNPLPVTLTTFTAQAVQNRDALLKWTTASEVDNDHFDVERSFDGTSFTKIGQVAGQGTKATATDYSLPDAGVAAKATGPVYYRLRQVDINGTATYSPVRTVSFTQETATLGLYPSPATTSTTLDLSQLPTSASYQVVLLDVTGRSVRTWSLGGGQPQTLELTDVATGNYLLQVTGTQPNGTTLHQTLRLTKN
ncbi:MAG: hypothetical protein ACRYFX_04275 [Janthinobacterium lividum]